MPTPTPTPYRNLQMDIANEEDNAEHLQLGIEDAKARLKAASEQYKAMPGIPQEKIRDKAAQDLLDRTNRLEKVKSKAKEMEVPEKPSNFDLGSIINAFVPSAGAATLSETTGGPTFHPPMVTPQAPVQKAAQAVQGLRAAGVGRIGDKAQVEGKSSSKITSTTPFTMDPAYIKTTGDEFRNTPEWQRQDRGLNDLEHLVQLDAHRNASKSNVDLSALGAYEDAQNSRYGIKSNLQSGLKGAPIEDTSLKDMGEIQRRRGDMAKELINSVKATKFGQTIIQDSDGNSYLGGIQIPKPSNPSSGQNLRLREVNALRKYTDATFKEPEHQLSTINNMISRIESENPSYIGALPAKLEQMDTGNQRVLLGLIGMETYDQSAPARLAQYLKKLTNGTLTEHTKALLMDRLKRSAEDTHLKFSSAEEDVRDFSKSLRTLDPSDVENIVGSKVKVTKKSYPRAMNVGKPTEKFTEGGGKIPTVDELWEKRRTNK